MVGHRCGGSLSPGQQSGGHTPKAAFTLHQSPAQVALENPLLPNIKLELMTPLNWVQSLWAEAVPSALVSHCSV